MVAPRNKRNLPCNRPQKSWKPSKKRVVKACSRGIEKIIHFGAKGYGHNYSTQARNSFRARHKCSSANDKLTARYWACKNLWTKGGSKKSCPRGIRCKGMSPTRRSTRRKSPTRRRKSPTRRRKSPTRRSKSPTRRRKSPTRRSKSRK
jgi:hypothetical protein